MKAHAASSYACSSEALGGREYLSLQINKSCSIKQVYIQYMVVSAIGVTAWFATKLGLTKKAK